ncbi:MAG: SUMF1/EgtB/PvdO family nonheme iron enzyme [Bacteroidaceae bacterium]|nr:SUMF1/EgtB/PvdO family nonheme iron enzyme [Bacteroidaceae bacterium]
MNNNGAATADNEPKKPFNWKIPVGIVAAILCVVFAGVGINNCNNERAEQERLAIIEKARRDSIATARKAAEDKRISDSIANELRNAFVTKNFTVDNVSFTMVAVAGGTFNMGSNDGYSDEKPVHSVTLSDYYIGETEVTQELWKAVMGSNPSYFKGDKNPVEQVSYNDCIDFINKLNILLAGQLPDGRKFRLPTEAQWEFAARGGDKSKGYKYSGSNSIDDVAWYWNSGKTHLIRQKQPNELGLYDMSGNVHELCSDWYGDYSSSPQTNPEGPSNGKYRVLRGGSWIPYVPGCRVADRARADIDKGFNYHGLRLAF